jgi:hypothetical protein
MQHQAIEAGVRDQQIAAPAEHKERNAALAGPISRLNDLRFGRRIDEPAGRPPDLEGGERRKRFVFDHVHGFKATPAG